MNYLATQADDSACGFYRIVLPCAEMNVMRGHRTRVTKVLAGDPTADIYPPGMELIVVQRIAEPELADFFGGYWQEHFGVPVIYELDDLVTDLHPSNTMAWDYYMEGGRLDAIKRLLAEVDAVTTTTPTLAKELSEYNDHVHILPNQLPNWIGKLRTWRPSYEGPPRLVYTGGPSHAVDVGHWDVIGRAVKKLPVTMTTYGHPWLKELGLTDEQAQFRPWTQDFAAYQQSLTQYDIGIAPLMPTRFNRSKCLDSETPVSTRDGLVSIGSVAEGDEVMTRDGWRKVLATSTEIAGPGVCVVLDNGVRIKMTGDHRMLVNGEWVEGGDIKQGDRLAVGPVGFGSRQRVSFNFFNSQHTSRPDVIGASTPSVEIDETWGEFLGFFVGDGSASSSTTTSISCDGQDADVVDRVVGLFGAFGITAKTTTKKMFDGTYLRRQAVNAPSRVLLDFLASLGLVTDRGVDTKAGRRRVVCVPEVIKRSDSAVVAAFLRGYFEADGSVVSCGVEACSKDEQFLRDVQVLLMQFGIHSVLKSFTGSQRAGYGDRHYWKLRLRRASADVFWDEIGFIGERKQRRLGALTERAPTSNNYKPMPSELEVVAVEPCWLTPVDLQVDGSEFVAHGVTSHNSDIKVLEYWAAGVVPVASDLDPYNSTIEHGVDGFLCRTDKDWSEAITTLVQDAELLHKMQQAGYDRAAERTIGKNIGKWEAAYRDTLERCAS
jgi:hypothetical protein